ncbi:MAG: cysteine desulfurase-like protein [Candidatus Eremiobacteraeota bacterium]|nr:cysteine desulfurase-like protein [Candidatus Eremiobacteraeota bacterium]
MSFPIERVRAEFPALALTDGGRPRIYLDNPAGTQVPKRVAEATARALLETNANLGGYFVTSRQAEQTIEDARERVAQFLGAASSREIIVGPSMTSLTFRLSRALARRLAPGDEIVVTRMDHDGNISPWLAAAADRGLVVRWLDFDRDSWRIEPSALDRVLTHRTRIVALNYASNLTGSINDVRTLVERIHAAGALAYVDAVQFAPHGFIDVAHLGCDFLACSSYKFFGPHMGIVYGRESLLEDLEAYKVRPATNDLPWRFELGTPQIELFAALGATIAYYDWLGEELGEQGDTRAKMRAAFAASRQWEEQLARRLIEGLQHLEGTTIFGITDPASAEDRVPTVSFVHAAISTDDIAKAMADRNIFVWSGNNYALELVRTLGLNEEAGVVRIGAAHYNTAAEIDATLEALEEYVRSRAALSSR